MSDTVAYVGIWYNYSRGVILGSTLTIPAKYGAFLVAFLALYVKWAGEHFWGMLRFVLHQYRSTPEARDAFYHQQQIILRNDSSETSTIWRLIQLSLSWRSKTHAPIQRNLFLISTAAIHGIGFVVAGILSSRVTNTFDEVLVKSDHCGWPKAVSLNFLTPSWKADWDFIDSAFVYGHAAFTHSLAIARACYSNQNTQKPSLCDSFVVQHLGSTVDRAAPCPFAEGVCKTAAISMDTGILHSDVHLGVNQPIEDRISFRRVTSCSPISADEKYATEWTKELKPGTFLSTHVPGDSFKYYYMGPSLFLGLPLADFSYHTSNFSTQIETQSYVLWCLSSYVGNHTESGFLPIQELNRTDADVNLLLLHNLATFTSEVTDPWFEATAQSKSPGSKLVPGEHFVSSHVLNVVGCTEQYQLCNHAGKCTPLSGLFPVAASINALGLSPNQFATAKMIWRAARVMTLFFQTSFLGSDQLIANDYLYGKLKVSPALRPTHWHTEMENMHNVSLAILQLLTVQYASRWQIDVRPGLTTSDCIDLVNNTAAESSDWRLCNSIKIRSTSYSSFSMLGLTLILGFGSIIIALDLCLSDIVFWCWNRRQKKGRIGDNTHQTRQRTWDDGALLQVQRMAFEGRGVGPWENRNDPVPVTAQFAKSFPTLEGDSWVDSATQNDLATLMETRPDLFIGWAI